MSDQAGGASSLQHQKVGAGRSGPDLTEKDLDTIKAMKFTKRLCLQAAAQNFDPLGLITAYSVKFKLGLKELVALEYGWDDILADELQEKWKTLLCESLQLPELVFPRPISHKLKVSRPEIIAYADGSTIAFGSVIYVRFRLDPDAEAPYNTALLTSKSRVTPKHGLTAPRSELQGLIIAVRVVDRIINALDARPLRVTIITDSQCSVAALDVNASSLATFFANRALEISNTMKSWGPKYLEAKEELSDIQLAELLRNSITHVDLLQHTPNLPTKTPGLHLCEEELIVSGAQLPHSPPPGPTAPPTQCAPDLSHSEDHEVVKLNTFLSFAINNVVVDIEEPYHCPECGLREAFIYGDKYKN